MRENAEYIEINDFSPGIYSDYQYDSGKTPAETQEGNILAFGAATVQDTARCHADRSGALVPLPKLVAGKQTAVMPTASNADARYLTGHKINYLMDGVVRGDLVVYGNFPAVVPDRAAVYTMYGFPYKHSGDTFGHWTTYVQMHDLFDTGGVHDLSYSRGTGALDAITGSNMQLGMGNFIPFRARDVIGEEGQVYDCQVWVAHHSPGYTTTPGSLQVGTMGAADLAVTDFDAWTDTTFPGRYQRVIGIFPRPDDPDSTSSGFLDDTHGGPAGALCDYACLLVAHQGRFIALTREPRDMGSSLSDPWGIITESVWYSPVQDFYGELGYGCFEKALFAEEKPYRTGAVASITADEIIFIKDRGGAVLVRGDLDNPTVVQLPYVESTHGARSIPVSTNFGLVYGTSNGVYVWEGGEVSRHLSAQIDGWFWNHNTALNYLGNRGRFGWWNPFVMAPNNFLFDSRNESWWRIDSPANTGLAFSAYDVSDQSNTLYAFPYGISAANTNMWFTASPEELSRTYTWKSQPLVESRNRVMTLQEVHLLVTPSSTTPATVVVTLTAIGKDGVEVTPVVTTFTTTGNTNPQMLHKDLVTNIQGTHIQVKITADSGADAAPAPKIHSVRFATAGRARVAKG